MKISQSTRLSILLWLDQFFDADKAAPTDKTSRSFQRERLDLHTQQVSVKLKVKAVFICQQFPPSDSRGWYFEEQAGEGKGMIKNMFQTLFSNWREQKGKQRWKKWSYWGENNLKSKRKGERQQRNRWRNRKGWQVKGWAMYRYMKECKQVCKH